jgi:hypothetical protein
LAQSADQNRPLLTILGRCDIVDGTLQRCLQGCL